MKTRKSSEKVAGMSSAAVRAATGKTWKQWVSTLDKAGARKMTHKEIVAVVSGEHGIGPWWQQMVTVGYEQARGLRQKHETSQGFQISRSKTFAVPVATAFRAWQDKNRKQWLEGDRTTIRKATPGKSIRASWDGGATLLDINFYPKGAGKTQVTVQQSKLKTSAAAEKMKTFWRKNLNRLQEVLET